MLHFLVILAVLLCANIHANPLNISYDGQYQLTSTVSYFFTEDKELEFQELLSIEDSLKWQKNGSNSINLGFGDGIYWLRTQVINENRLVSNWVLELSYAPLDQIEIYLVKNAELIEYHFGGDTVAHNDKSIEYPHTVFL